MTPLQIRMLLHYSYSPDPFQPWGAAQSEARDRFREEKLIDDEGCGPCSARLTERGQAYVGFLIAMPLPVANWSIPGPWNPSIPPQENQP